MLFDIGIKCRLEWVVFWFFYNLRYGNLKIKSVKKGKILIRRICLRPLISRFFYTKSVEFDHHS